MSHVMITAMVAFLAFLLATVLFAWLAFLAGRLLGMREARKDDPEPEGPVSSVVAATLALLAFTLAITFNMAHEKYNSRKELVRDDAKAIRSAYDRALLLPEEETVVAQAKLAEYARIRAFDTFLEEDVPIAAIIARCEQIQRALWLQAIEHRGEPQVRFYMDALSMLTNVHADRITVGIHDRVPRAVWICLIIVTALGMVTMGYQSALVGSKRAWAIVPLLVSFCIVFCIAVDLDRPQQGILRVDQGPVIRLAASLSDLPAGL